MLKEYLYFRQFPNFIMSSAIRLNDDIKYVHEFTKNSKVEMQNKLEESSKKMDNNFKAFEKTIDDKLEILHQELLNLRDQQTKF